MADTLFNICFLKKFNNYFNRKVIGYQTLAEYMNAAEDFFIPDHTINFDPRDNVSTEIIMNECPFDADYCLVLDLENNILNRWFVMEVVFIRRGQKTYKLRRDVIYDYLEELTLSPVFVQKGWLKDNDPFIFNPEGMSFNQIKTTERLLKDKTNSAWLVGYIAKNAAPTDVNIQTKVEEIKDYVTLDSIAAELGVSISDLAKVLNFGSDRTNAAFFSTKFTLKYGLSTSDIIPFILKVEQSFNGDLSEHLDDNSDWVTSWNKTLFKVKFNYGSSGAGEVITSCLNDISDQIVIDSDNIKNDLPLIFNRPYFSSEQLDILYSYNGKKVQYNGSIYQLNLSESGVDKTTIGPQVYSSFYSLGGTIDWVAQNTFDFVNYTDFHTDGEISLIQESKRIYITLSDSQAGTTIPAMETKISSSRITLNNNAFDMFCIPFNKASIKKSSDYYYTSEEVAVRVAIEIAKELDASLYDIQLLPYFPRTDLISLVGVRDFIDISNLTENEDYNFIKTNYSLISKSIVVKGTDKIIEPQLGPNNYKVFIPLIDGTAEDLTGATVTYTIDSGTLSVYYESIVVQEGKTGLYAEFRFDPAIYNDVQVTFSVSIPAGSAITSILFWNQSNSFSLKLNEKIQMHDSTKIESECNLWRLCSPNYQGSFDFNVAKNGGVVNYLIADCTYKPYTPYIKIAPAFNYLYGTNYGDARGLICGGDFSISRFTSAWETYELNNKNYQNIFNREIQKLDFEQSLEYRKSLISGGVGIFTGGVGGAAAGGMASGSWIGAVAGGVAGTAGSAIGMGLDIDMLVKQQRENKQFAIDKFNYELGNIKALPYTLTKVGAFNINSKIWPFLEYYTCTEQEKTALENKLKYESMTVMRIGFFGDFWRVDSELRYFKGELIRNDEIAEDNHIFEAIYGEILKGVYM